VLFVAFAFVLNDGAVDVAVVARTVTEEPVEAAAFALTVRDAGA